MFYKLLFVISNCQSNDFFFIVVDYREIDNQDNINIVLLQGKKTNSLQQLPSNSKNFSFVGFCLILICCE